MSSNASAGKRSPRPAGWSSTSATLIAQQLQPTVCLGSSWGAVSTVRWPPTEATGCTESQAEMIRPLRPLDRTRTRRLRCSGHRMCVGFLPELNGNPCLPRMFADIGDRLPGNPVQYSPGPGVQVRQFPEIGVHFHVWPQAVQQGPRSRGPVPRSKVGRVGCPPQGAIHARMFVKPGGVREALRGVRITEAFRSRAIPPAYDTPASCCTVPSCRSAAMRRRSNSRRPSRCATPSRVRAAHR